MKRFLQNLALGPLMILTISGCVDATDTQTQASLTEAQFREEVVGARLVWEGGETRYFDDGTFTGTSGDEVLTGKWAYEDGDYCRSGSIGGKPFSHGCERVTLQGNTLTFFGEDGVKYIYKVQR